MKKKKSKRERLLLKRTRKQRFLLIGFLIAFIGLFSRTLYIYIVYGDEYYRRAIRQQALHRNVDQFITPNRGNIMDRNGQLLAIGSSVYNVIIDVRLIHDSVHGTRVNDRNRANSALEALNYHLDLEAGRLESYFEISREYGTESYGRPARDTNFLILERGISPILAQNFINHFPFIVLEEDTSRTYPRGYLAANVIGFLSGDGNHWGLEGYYNTALSGTPGRRIRQFTEHGIAQTNEFLPVNGKTLLTTLDAALQERLLEIVTRYSSKYEVRRGMIIVTNPHTGEIVSMVQYPSFNNAAPTYIGDVTSPRMRDRLRTIEGEQRTGEFFRIWANSNINHSFEPGSIFKPLIAAAALEEGLININSHFYCPGFIDIGGQRIHCWIFAHGSTHGDISLSDAMAVSCNVAAIMIGNLLGRDRFYDWVRDFGVGQLTGVDLVGEASVLSLTYTRDELNPVELATSSIGQGFNMTPIQALNSFNAIINGGYLMRPFIVSGIVDQAGNIISENEPAVLRNILSSSTSDFWREEMERTVSWQRATGTTARVEGVSVGGKTGTGQQHTRGSFQYSNSFITYLPVENPRYSVIVTLYIPEFNGGPSRLPAGIIGHMAREVMEQIVLIRGVHTTVSVPFQDSAILEDYVGLSSVAAVNKIIEKGLIPDVSGRGTVVTSQHPAEGISLPIGTRVFLFLEEADEYENEEEQSYFVPNLLGLDVYTASYMLLGLGFNYSVFYVHENENLQGIITAQMPLENSRVGEGTSVSIIVE
ncbi:MAG: penicillin-binding transpeptidase domain-containing protein [Defluviitaleaceae bacterium]|nr:penicillin-binding transpeptidase domain-containing protein [Defluviitaleaceae bacterium]